MRQVSWEDGSTTGLEKSYLLVRRQQGSSGGLSGKAEAAIIVCSGRSIVGSMLTMF